MPLCARASRQFTTAAREPLIVIWPGKVKGGSRNEEAIVQSIDFYPTLVEMCSLKLPELPAFDGISFVPALGGRKLGRDSIFCHFPHYGVPDPNYVPASYVRKGDWKLIRFYFEGPDFTDRYELYDLKNDIGEHCNLASKNPEKVEEFKALLEKYLRFQSRPADSKSALPPLERFE